MTNSTTFKIVASPPLTPPLLKRITVFSYATLSWKTNYERKAYLKGNPMELMIGLAEYFVFYNDERPHQSIGNRTPAEVFATGSNGGARIVDKFSKNEAASCSCEKDEQTSLN